MRPARITLIAKRLTHSAIILALSIFTYACSVSGVIAGSGLLTSVGGATFVQGAKQFWVSSARPTFSGLTTAGATVGGNVGPETISATADSSGNWSWTSAADLTGDNAVAITSGSTTVAFMLTIGDLPADVASASASTLAPAGTVNPMILILGGGLILLILGSFGIYKSRG